MTISRRWQIFIYSSVCTLVLASVAMSAPQKDQLEDAQEIQKVVERLRHQPITGKLKMGVVSKKEVIEFLDKRIAEEYSSDEFRQMEATAKLLDLMPWSYDYRREIRAIMVEQIGGFYDHTTQELYIADWISGFIQKPVLAHEIFHGVQVQEWDAARLLDTEKLKLDQLMAHQALMEGDATIVMAHFTVADAKLDETTLNGVFEQTVKSAMHGLALKPSVAKFVGSSERFASAPRHVKRSLVLPYAMGAEFVIALRREAKWDWKRINQVYKDPPETTEQILRPTAYWNKRESPIRPKRLFKMPTTWKVLKEDTFGLMMFSEALDREAEHNKPPLVLEGWAGDETLLFGKGEDMILAINSAWDTKTAAESFAEKWRLSYRAHDACAVHVSEKQVMVILGRGASQLHDLMGELELKK